MSRRAAARLYVGAGAMAFLTRNQIWVLLPPLLTAGAAKVSGIRPRMLFPCTRLRGRIETKAVTHSSYVIFQMAEVADYRKSLLGHIC